MMNNISMIFQKELKRVFCDKKLIFSLYVFPVIMVLVIYGLISILIQSVEDDQSNHVPQVAVYHMPASLQEFVGDSFYEDYEVSELNSDEELETAKNGVLNENIDLILVFDENFDERISGYQTGDEIPDVHTYYNPSADYSYNARDELVYGVLEDYRQFLLEERFGDLTTMTIFSVDQFNTEAVIQDEDKAAGEMLGSFIPYLVTILLFAGGMSIGVDMIAGEKERGTMASLLITPIPRTCIVLGKLFAMMVLSGLSALVYVISMVVAIPLFMNSAINTGAGEEAMESVSALGFSMNFQAWQIWMLIIIIVAMVFVYVAVITLTAVFAKDTKEANTYITPIYMVVMLSGMVTMFTGDQAGTGTYCIPLYGAVIAIKNILGQNITALNCLVTALTHLIVGGVVVLIVAKAFDSEKVMFDA